MKRDTLLILAFPLIMTLSGCAAGNNSGTVSDPSSPSMPAEMTASAAISEDANEVYAVNTKLSTARLPLDAQNAFDHVDASTVEGAVSQPIVLLGRQTGSSYYAILCYLHDDLAEAGKEDALQVITVFEDEYGNAAIADSEDFNLSNFAGKDHLYQPDEGTTSAFETNTEYETQDNLPAADILSAKSDALYDAAALLGTSGNKSLLLCLRTRKEDQRTTSAWSVVTIETSSNTSRILSVYELDPGAFTILRFNTSAAD